MRVLTERNEIVGVDETDNALAIRLRNRKDMLENRSYLNNRLIV
jgi:hypothetical protein